MPLVLEKRISRLYCLFAHNVLRLSSLHAWSEASVDRQRLTSRCCALLAVVATRLRRRGLLLHVIDASGVRTSTCQQWPPARAIAFFHLLPSQRRALPSLRDGSPIPINSSLPIRTARRTAPWVSAAVVRSPCSYRCNLLALRVKVPYNAPREYGVGEHQ